MSDVPTRRSEERSESHPTPQSSKALPSLSAKVSADLRSKQALLSSAFICLEDEKSYAFFDLLASLSRLEKGSKKEWLEFLATTGTYDPNEMGAIERLVMGEGAASFKSLVDMVREIRVQQEIDVMVGEKMR